MAEKTWLEVITMVMTLKHRFVCSSCFATNKQWYLFCS
jgi:hypothetical protein